MLDFLTEPPPISRPRECSSWWYEFRDTLCLQQNHLYFILFFTDHWTRRSGHWLPRSDLVFIWFTHFFRGPKGDMDCALLSAYSNSESDFLFFDEKSVDGGFFIAGWSNAKSFLDHTGEAVKYHLWPNIRSHKRMRSAEKVPLRRVIKTNVFPPEENHIRILITSLPLHQSIPSRKV